MNLPPLKKNGKMSVRRVQRDEVAAEEVEENVIRSLEKIGLIIGMERGVIAVIVVIGNGVVEMVKGMEEDLVGVDVDMVVIVLVEEEEVVDTIIPIE